MSVQRLPDLNAPYSVSQDQHLQYQRDGHILLRGLATPEEIGVWRGIIGDAVDSLNTETRSLEERDTYGKAFLQITNLWQKAEAVKGFVLARRFAGVAAELMGVEGVRLYHDQALYKEPGGGPTPWHQDQYYWPLDGVPTVTMWMPLVSVPVEMGALTFASGSHKEGFQGHIRISDESEEHYSKLVQERGYPVVNSEMRAGDATFHSGWTLHNAPGNRTERMREVMTIIYLADGGCISEPDNENRRGDLAAWFPGLKPGDAAASPINPLLYSREG